MQIVDNHSLLLVTKKYRQIDNLIPRSKVLEVKGDKGKVLVNWGPEEVRLLRNLKIKDVPHPILGQYGWPGVYQPFAHQRETAAFLASNPRCLNLSEAGTGKTSAAAWAADYLMAQGIIKRCLIICPLSIMDTAWRSDLFKTCMHRTVGIASGSREKRKEIIEGDYEFVIINYDGVKVAQDALASGGFDLIIADEATALKNPGTHRWKSVAALVKPATWLWLMTGTPAAQSPMDAYGLARLVNPGNVPKFITAWKYRVMRQVTQYKWVPREDAYDQVYEALQPAIRFTKEDCLDLPEMLYTDRHVELTKQQMFYYRQILEDKEAIANGAEITAVHAASQMNKLLQVSQGAAYSNDKEVVEFDISHRLAELVDVIHNTRHKVLVFVPFRHVLERLETDLRARHFRVASIHGGTSATARAQTIRAFQTQDDPHVLLMIPQAAAHGITLTRADTVVWWGPVASAELYLQGNARAHRAGQSNKVTVVRLAGSPVEKRLYQMLDGRLDAHAGLVELYRQELA